MSKMMKQFFDQKIQPACSYCAFGNESSDREKILCPKKGVVTKDYSCRRFRYDPLKRVPKKPVGQTFEAEDFSF